METITKKKQKKTFALHYRQTGSGPDVVGISGFACGHWLLHPLAATLERHFTVWLPDNRGMGRSPKGDGDFSIDDMARDVIEIIKKAIGRPVKIMGVSMGGFIVQALLSIAPEWVTQAAILCSTSAGPRFRPLFSFWGPTQMQRVLAMDRVAYARWILDPPVSPCLAAYPEAMAFMLRHRLDHPEDLQQVMGQYYAMARFFQTEVDLSRIDIPVWVGCGQDDPVFPPANSQLLAQSLPRGELVIFPDTDHLFFVERPEDVGQALVEFFHRP
ncbi:MAG: alpha/beta hydrolase [Magnetococcales bacterium]|nr:alpha/beta hydrolase [Magnetococcales bacterium]